MRALLLVLVFSAMLGCAPGRLAAQPSEAAVTIDNFVFGPQRLTVKAGTTVTWTNRDDIPHTVVAPGHFKSKVLDTGESYSFTFSIPGEYAYFCSLHPHMTAAVVVEAAGAEAVRP